jgi:hypothetical protein
VIHFVLSMLQAAFFLGLLLQSALFPLTASIILGDEHNFKKPDVNVLVNMHMSRSGGSGDSGGDIQQISDATMIPTTSASASSSSSPSSSEDEEENMNKLSKSSVSSSTYDMESYPANADLLLGKDRELFYAAIDLKKCWKSITNTKTWTNIFQRVWLTLTRNKNRETFVESTIQMLSEIRRLNKASPLKLFKGSIEQAEAYARMKGKFILLYIEDTPRTNINSKDKNDSKDKTENGSEVPIVVREKTSTFSFFGKNNGKNKINSPIVIGNNVDDGTGIINPLSETCQLFREVLSDPNIGTYINSEYVLLGGSAKHPIVAKMAEELEKSLMDKRGYLQYPLLVVLRPTYIDIDTLSRNSAKQNNTNKSQAACKLPPTVAVFPCGANQKSWKADIDSKKILKWLKQTVTTHGPEMTAQKKDWEELIKRD